VSLGTSCKNEDVATLDIAYEAAGSYADPSLFRATFSQEGRRLTFDGSDLHVRSRTAAWFAGSFTLRTVDANRDATVDVVLVSNGDTLGAGSASWRAQKDWTYGVSAYVAPTRPQGHCFEIRDAKPLPSRNGSSGDSLFVVFAGLPYGAIC